MSSKYKNPNAYAHFQDWYSPADNRHNFSEPGFSMYIIFFD